MTPWTLTRAALGWMILDSFNPEPTEILAIEGNSSSLFRRTIREEVLFKQ